MSKFLACYDADEIHELALKVLSDGVVGGVDESKITPFLNVDDADLFIEKKTKEGKDGSGLYSYVHTSEISSNALAAFNNSIYDPVRKALSHLTLEENEALIKEVLAIDQEALAKCGLTPFGIRPFLSHEGLVSIFEGFLDKDNEKAKKFFPYLAYADWLKFVLQYKEGLHKEIPQTDFVQYLTDDLKKDLKPKETRPSE